MMIALRWMNILRNIASPAHYLFSVKMLGISQLLKVSKLSSESGAEECDVIFETISEWNLEH